MTEDTWALMLGRPGFVGVGEPRSLAMLLAPPGVDPSPGVAPSRGVARPPDRELRPGVGVWRREPRVPLDGVRDMGTTGLGGVALDP